MKDPSHKPRISLVGRLSLVTAFLTLLTIIAAAGSFWFSAAAGRNLDTVRMNADLAANTSDLQIAWLSVVDRFNAVSVSQPEPESRQALDLNLDELDRKLNGLTAAVSTGVSFSRSTDNAAILTDVGLTFTALRQLVAEVYKLSAEGRYLIALQRRQSGLAELGKRFETSLDRLNANMQSDLAAMSELSRRSQTQSQRVSILLMLLASVAAIGSAWVGRQAISKPMQQLIAQVQRLTGGDFSPVEPLARSDEIGELSSSLKLLAEWLRGSYDELEHRVQERTKALERRSLQVQVASQVARDITAARDLESLLNSAVNLIRERFGFYHAGIFLTDARGEFQVLRAATGEAGRLLLERGHSLRMGQTSLVGHAAHSGAARVSANVAADLFHYKNPLLPETRSEAALPLKTAGRVIGVLDVQSDQPEAFDLESLDILQVLADQLATAIQNARLLAEVQASLEQLQTAYGEISRQAWLRLFQARQVIGYTSDGIEIRPLEAQTPASGELTVAGEPADEAVEGPVSLPLQVRGGSIGAVDVWPRTGRLTESERSLLVTLSSRLSQILENARLYDEIRSRAAREEAINRLTAGIARALDLDGTLKATAVEFGRLPAVSEAAVVLDLPPDTLSEPPVATHGGSDGYHA